MNKIIKHCVVIFSLILNGFSAFAINLNPTNIGNFCDIQSESCTIENISFIENDTFIGYNNLKNLSIINGPIAYISTYAFNGLQNSLETLDLSFNKIEDVSFDYNMFSNYTKLNYINLNQNCLYNYYYDGLYFGINGVVNLGDQGMNGCAYGGGGGGNGVFDLDASINNISATNNFNVGDQITLVYDIFMNGNYDSDPTSIYFNINGLTGISMDFANFGGNLNYEYINNSYTGSYTNFVLPNNYRQPYITITGIYDGSVPYVNSDFRIEGNVPSGYPDYNLDNNQSLITLYPNIISSSSSSISSQDSSSSISSSESSISSISSVSSSEISSSSISSIDSSSSSLISSSSSSVDSSISSESSSSSDITSSSSVSSISSSSSEVSSISSSISSMSSSVASSSLSSSVSSIGSSSSISSSIIYGGGGGGGGGNIYNYITSSSNSSINSNSSYNISSTSSISSIKNSETIKASDNIINYVSGENQINILGNDTLNNNPTNLNEVDIKITNAIGIKGVKLDSNGNLILPQNITNGTKLISYQICSKSNPTICDKAYVRLKVNTNNNLTTNTPVEPITTNQIVLPAKLWDTGTPLAQKGIRIIKNYLVQTDDQISIPKLDPNIASKNLSDWTKYLPITDRNKDGYIVVPSAGIVVPTINTTNPIEINNVLQGGTFNISPYLAQGALFYPGTANIRSDTGNSVYAAHSSYWKNTNSSYKTAFKYLPEVDLGQQVWVYIKQVDGTYKLDIYDVIESYETQAQNTSPLLETKNSRTLTLFTCTPIGSNKNRWIVRAKKIN